MVNGVLCCKTWESNESRIYLNNNKLNLRWNIKFWMFSRENLLGIRKLETADSPICFQRLFGKKILLLALNPQCNRLHIHQWMYFITFFACPICFKQWKLLLNIQCVCQVNHIMPKIKKCQNILYHFNYCILLLQILFILDSKRHIDYFSFVISMWLHFHYFNIY